MIPDHHLPEVTGRGREPAKIVVATGRTNCRLSIADHDVDRARERADILATITGADVLAAVIGTAISEANRERARSGNVRVLMIDSGR